MNILLDNRPAFKEKQKMSARRRQEFCSVFDEFSMEPSPKPADCVFSMLSDFHKSKMALKYSGG